MALDYNQIKEKYGEDLAKEFMGLAGSPVASPQYRDPRNSGMNVDPGAIGKINTENADLYARRVAQAQAQAQQGWAKSKGNKDLFLQAGGVVDPNDPWGFYRESAGNQLNEEFLQKEDPSNFYREKLQNLSKGEFGAGDPSYDWRFQQGQQATERSLASRGLLNSGNAALELQQYGQGAASQEYQAEFERTLQGLSGVSQQYDTQFQRLAGMAGIGLDPAASGKLATQQQANHNQKMDSKLDYSARMASLDQQQGQWDDELGMAQQFEGGLRDTLSANPQANLQQQANRPSPYSSYNSSQPMTGGPNANGGTQFPNSGFVVRTS